MPNHKITNYKLDQLFDELQKNPAQALEKINSYITQETSIELQLLQGIGEAYLWHYDRAQEILIPALKKAVRKNIIFATGIAFDELAGSYLIQSEVDSAMRTWLKSLAYAIAQHDFYHQLRANLGIGKVYYGMDDFKNAKKYHLAATESCFLAKSISQLSEVYTCLGVDYTRMHEYNRAYAALKIAENNLQHAQYPYRNQCEIYIYLGIVHQGLKQYSIAFNQIDNALKIAIDHNYTWGAALATLEKAKLCYLKQQNNEAIQLAQQAARLAKQISSLVFLSQAHELMYTIFKESNQYQAALEQHILFSGYALEKVKRSKETPLSAATVKILKKTNELQEFEASQLENAYLLSRLETHQLIIQQLTNKAETDALTGVFNRRALDQRLEQEVSLAVQLNQALSVLMIDLDFFKKINDQFSHQTGDKVLQQVAKLITQCCRQSEFVARFGGEEFIVLLPLANHAAAMRIAERIRRSVAQFAWSTINPVLNVTTSIGVACHLIHDTAESIFLRADQHLYRAKENGRNQVCGDPAPIE